MIFLNLFCCVLTLVHLRKWIKLYCHFNSGSEQGQEKSRMSECTGNTGASDERLTVQFSWCSCCPSSLQLLSGDLKLLCQNGKHIWMNTFANLALPEHFRFCCLHTVRAKQGVVQSCPVSQNETICDCTDGVTFRVTPKPSCDSPDHSSEVVLPLLRSRFDKHSKIQDLPVNRCFLNHVTLHRQTLVVNLESSFHACTWPVRLQLPPNAVTATFLCFKTRLENLRPPAPLACPGVFWGRRKVSAVQNWPRNAGALKI